MMQQGAAVEPWRTHGPVLRPCVRVCVRVCARAPAGAVSLLHCACVWARARRCRLSAALKVRAPCEDQLQCRILLIYLNLKVYLSLSSFRACVCLCVYVPVSG